MKKNKKSKLFAEVISDIYISVMLVVFPLFFGANGYVDITQVKYRFFLWTSLIYIALLIIGSLEAVLVGNEKLSDLGARFKSAGPVQYLMITYLVFCSVSAVLSEFGVATLNGLGRNEGLYTTALYVGVFLLLSFFGRPKRWCLIPVGVVIVLNSVIGFLQYAGFNPFTLFPAGYTYHDAFIKYASAFMGTLGNVDLLSAYLSLSVTLFVIYLIVSDHKYSALSLLPVFFGVFTLLLCGVSAGILGAILAIFLTIPLTLSKRKQFLRGLICGSVCFFAAALYFGLSATYINGITNLHFSLGTRCIACFILSVLTLILRFFFGKSHVVFFKKRRTAIRFLSCIVVLCIVLGVALLYFLPFESGTIGEIHGVLNGKIDDKIGSGRIAIWRECLKLIPGHLLFGGGPDTLAERINYVFTRYSNELGMTIESHIDNAHNDYLNILVNTGVLSLIAYIASLGLLGIKAIKRSGRSSVLILGTAALAYCIQVFFSFSICIVAPFFWICLGLLCSELNSKSVEVEVIKN